MKNPITKIKNFAKNHADEIVAGAAIGGIAAGAYIAGVAVHKYVILKDAIIVPANLVNHLKTLDGGILGCDVIEGYDILVRLIPVVKS